MGNLDLTCNHVCSLAIQHDQECRLPTTWKQKYAKVLVNSNDDNIKLLSPAISYTSLFCVLRVSFY